MPLAISQGFGSAKVPARLAAIENVNGQAITLANKHKGVTGAADLRGMTLGVPFDYSMHNFLLRHYLSTGGLDPTATAGSARPGRRTARRRAGRGT